MCKCIINALTDLYFGNKLHVKMLIFFCRNLAIGLCSSIARVGGIIAPLILLIVSGKN